MSIKSDEQLSQTDSKYNLDTERRTELAYNGSLAALFQDPEWQHYIESLRPKARPYNPNRLTTEDASGIVAERLWSLHFVEQCVSTQELPERERAQALREFLAHEFADDRQYSLSGRILRRRSSDGQRPSTVSAELIVERMTTLVSQFVGFEGTDSQIHDIEDGAHKLYRNIETMVTSRLDEIAKLGKGEGKGSTKTY